MSGSTLGRLSAALLLIATLPGCGGGQSAITRGGVTILVHDGALLPRGGNDALITGALTQRNGCVGLASDDALGGVVPVIWPSGTELVEDAPLSLRLPSGAPVVEGQHVQGAGGYAAPGSTDITIEVPEACALDRNEIAVFNPDDDPIVVE